MLRPLLLEFLDEAVGSFVLYRFLWHAQRPIARHRAAFDDERLCSGELGAFFGPIPSPLELDAQWRRVVQSRAYGGTSRFAGEISDFRFPSPVQTAYPTSDVVWLRRWKNAAVARCVVLGLDGLVQRGSGWFHRLACLLQRDAVDVVMMDEPFNYRRTPPGYQPGQLIVGGDLMHQLAVLRQSVLDAWQVIRSLRQGGYRVGVVGMSFGALLALLLATVVPDLDFVIALVPPVDPVTLLKERSQVVRAMRRPLTGLRLDEPRYAGLLRPVRPMQNEPLLPPPRIRLHIARHDRFVSSPRIHDLAERWQAPHYVHDEGHCSLYVSDRVAGCVAGEVCELVQGDSALLSRVALESNNALDYP